jgi:hypothetical protein
MRRDSAIPPRADTEKCQEAVDQLFVALLAGCRTPAEKYRNVAHAYSMITAGVREIREHASLRRHAAVEAEQRKER